MIMEPTFEQELEDWVIDFYILNNSYISYILYQDLQDKYPDKDIKQELIDLGLWARQMAEIIK